MHINGKVFDEFVDRIHKIKPELDKNFIGACILGDRLSEICTTDSLEASKLFEEDPQLLKKELDKYNDLVEEIYYFTCVAENYIHNAISQTAEIAENPHVTEKSIQRPVHQKNR